MLEQKVKDYFEKYPELKILFLFDPDKSHTEEIAKWNNKEVLLIKVNEELFSLKYRLEFELRDTKVFLYFQKPQPTKKHLKTFPLTDLIAANKILLIDDVEDFIEEYNLKPYHRDRVKKYIQYLRNKKVQKTLSKILNPATFDDQNEYQIKKGLICYFLGFSSIEDDTIILARLFTSLLQKNKELFSVLDNIREIDSETYLCKLFDEYFDIEVASLNENDILFAVKKAKYNLILGNYSEAHLSDNYSQKLKILKPSKNNKLIAFINDWAKNSLLRDEIGNVFSELAGDVAEAVIIKNYGVDGDYGYYTSTLSLLIIKNIIDTIEYQPEKSISVLNLLSGTINQNTLEINDLIGYLLRIANVFKNLNTIPSYIFDKPKDYLEEYVDKLSKVDYNYRKSMLSYIKLRNHNYPKEIQVEDVTKRLNQKYEEFLKEINTQWLKCLEDHDFEFKNISVPKQYEFYKQRISDTEQKIAVIISDGLRFEAAQELLSNLHTDLNNQAKLSYMISSLPSNTRMGMSSLLPHSELEMKDEFIFINNISTEGLENREKILQEAEKDSKVVKFENLLDMRQDELRELFKSRVVYIYHNVIDAVGDDRKTEKRTFEEVDRAIKELAPMIKKIHSSYNVSKIFITADHGFLFNSTDLPESMYESLPDNKNAVINHNRFSLLKKEIKTDSYIFDLSKAANVNTNFKITIPKAINRYKRQGHGVHYVHGGASLQEMIIPVIESSRKREEVTEKVGFQILGKNLKVFSGALKIKILQDNPVNEFYKSVIIVCALYNANDEVVSNEIEILLESTSDLPTERTKELILNLNTKAEAESYYHLKVFDKQKDPNKLNPLYNEKIINHTLIQPDFE